MPIDLRTRKLANLALKYCVSLKAGETVIISGESEAEDFIIELYKAAILMKAHPIMQISPKNIDDFFYKYASKEQLEKFPQYWFDTIKTAKRILN